MTVILTFIQRAIMQGIPLLYGSTGEILTEKSGNLNLADDTEVKIANKEE